MFNKIALCFIISLSLIKLNHYIITNNYYIFCNCVGRVEYYVPENETLQAYRTNENEDSGLVTLIILTVEDPDTGIPPELTDPVSIAIEKIWNLSHLTSIAVVTC